jgi:hypothetical protein
MGIFDLLGAAGAGYTGGLVQGEQAKIKLLQQTKNNDFKQQQLDQVKLGNDLKAKDLTQQAQDPVRKAWLAYAHDLAAPISTPEGLAEADRNGHLGIRLQAIEHAYGQSMNPTNGDAPPSFNFAQNFAGQGEDAEGNLIDRVARPVQPTMKQEAEALRAQTGAKSAESLAELRKIEGNRLTTLTPVEAELGRRRTDLIGHQGPLMDAQAAAARATAAATPQRVANDTADTAERARENKARDALTAQSNSIRQTMANIAQQNADNTGKDTASKIKLRAAQEAKLNKMVQEMGKDLSPEKKAILSKLHPYYVDPLQGLVPVEEQIAQMEDVLGMERGTMPRTVTMPNRPTKGVQTSAPAATSKPGRTPEQEKRYQELLKKKQGK